VARDASGRSLRVLAMAHAAAAGAGAGAAAGAVVEERGCCCRYCPSPIRPPRWDAQTAAGRTAPVHSRLRAAHPTESSIRIVHHIAVGTCGQPNGGGSVFRSRPRGKQIEKEKSSFVCVDATST